MRRRATRSELTAVSLTAATNLVVNRLPPRVYVLGSVGGAGVLTWFARRSGATWPQMGMDPRRLGRGIRWGLAATIPISGAIALGVTVPVTRRFFVDERATKAGPNEVLYHTLIRIPVGTALAEEILFRGALLGILERHRPRSVADALTGVLFGLSHILPTIHRLDEGNASWAGRKSARARSATLAGVVVATMAAGYGFAWLRDRSGSLAAPVIAHAALNGLSFVAAWSLARTKRSLPGG